MSTAFHAANDVANSIDLYGYFSRKIRKGYSLNGFSEYNVFKNERMMSEIMSPDAFRALHEKDTPTTLELIIFRNIQAKLEHFYNSHKRTSYADLTPEENMFIGSELSRSFAAHVVGDVQSYGDYNQSLFKRIPTIISEACMIAFRKQIIEYGEGVEGEQKQVLDVDTEDASIIKALELRLARNIVFKLHTYDAEYHIKRIYEGIFKAENRKNREIERSM